MKTYFACNNYSEVFIFLGNRSHEKTLATKQNKKFASKIIQIINKISEMKDTVVYNYEKNEANVYMACIYNCTYFTRNMLRIS